MFGYWNSFVEEWRRLHAEGNNDLVDICEWTHPSIHPPLMNSDHPEDFSFRYLPEPWWGSSSDNELHSVVVNYNPGEGRFNQLHNMYEENFGNVQYQDLVSNEMLNPQYLIQTNNWHHRKRARRILSTLSSFDSQLQLLVEVALHHHLSIELIPWHTKKAEGEAFEHYIDNNAEQIYSKCLRFAAQRSGFICNDILKNKVILRMSAAKTRNLLYRINYEGAHPFEELTPNEGVAVDENARYFKFRFMNDIDDVEFISIWGRRSRNNFPPAASMVQIFNHAFPGIVH